MIVGGSSATSRVDSPRGRAARPVAAGAHWGPGRLANGASSAHGSRRLRRERRLRGHAPGHARPTTSRRPTATTTSPSRARHRARHSRPRRRPRPAVHGAPRHAGGPLLGLPRAPRAVRAPARRRARDEDRHGRPLRGDLRVGAICFFSARGVAYAWAWALAPALLLDARLALPPAPRRAADPAAPLRAGAGRVLR